MEIPKGKIVAIGGNEDKGTTPDSANGHSNSPIRFFDEGILRRIHDELHGLGTRIEVITSASLIPKEMGQAYLDAFLLLGCDNVGTLHIRNTIDVNRRDYLDRLSKADGVMFTGGDQMRLIEIFRGTSALEIIKTRYLQEEKFLVSGTSAGAMALTRLMIERSEETIPLIKGMVWVGPGLNFLDQMIIDTHFVNRRRIPRLIETIAAHPHHVGIGLGEDTGILITEGKCIETIGSGLVIIIDGRKLYYNNYESVSEGEAICLENLVMHVLPKGKAYWVDTGKLGQA